MDTTSPITHIGLCAGYGGIELGLHRVIRNLRSVALCEIEAFACANLVAKMEAGLLDCAPIWTDLKTFPWAEFRDRVDILTGGYPCQPFSAAGKRLGTEDPRHLWPHISAGIAAMRPSVCFFENVEGHISLGLPDVIEDLAGMGYRTTWGIFSASEVGAPHQRKRVFILAYRECEGLERFYNWNASTEQAENVGADAWASGECDTWPSRPGEPQHAWEPPRVVANDHRPHTRHGEQRPERTLGDLSGGCGEAMANATSTGLRKRQEDKRDAELAWASEAMGNPNSPRPQERPRQQRAGLQGADADGGEAADGAIEQPMGDPAYGTPDGLGVAELSGLSHQELAEIRHWMVASDNRTDELRLLGNGVVPATAERAFLTLWEELFQQQPTN